MRHGFFEIDFVTQQIQHSSSIRMVVVRVRKSTLYKHWTVIFDVSQCFINLFLLNFFLMIFFYSKVDCNALIFNELCNKRQKITSITRGTKKMRMSSFEEIWVGLNLNSCVLISMPFARLLYVVFPTLLMFKRKRHMNIKYGNKHFPFSRLWAVRQLRQIQSASL